MPVWLIGMALRLTTVKHITDVLHKIPVVNIEWQAADALPFPLCVSAKVDGVLVDTISVARGNVVLTDHGMTVNADALLPKAAPHSGNYRPILPHKHITVSTPYTLEDNPKVPASQMLIQNPHEAIPEIRLYEDGESWNPQRDLMASDPFCHGLCCRNHIKSHRAIAFGDDILGKKPEAGFQPDAIYRIGTGPSGNIGADAIGRIHWNSSGIRSVRNPLAAKGGQRAETNRRNKTICP